MARQPRHDSGSAGAKGPRDRPYKLPCTADSATRRAHVTGPHIAALLFAGGGGVVGLSRPSLHHTWDGHCGGFSRLESGTTIPLSPEAV